jgi:hypothetical protein
VEARGWTADGPTIADLPGAELVTQGLIDLQRGDPTVPALLVAVGAPRLRLAGVPVPEDVPDDPNDRLYRLLAAEYGDDAHGRYNSLVRRLVSFERALESLSRTSARADR